MTRLPNTASFEVASSRSELSLEPLHVVVTASSHDGEQVRDQFESLVCAKIEEAEVVIPEGSRPSLKSKRRAQALR